MKSVFAISIYSNTYGIETFEGFFKNTYICKGEQYCAYDIDLQKAKKWKTEKGAQKGAKLLNEQFGHLFSTFKVEKVYLD